MNRLGKILTLGLEKKRAWQLPLLAVFFLFGLRCQHHARPNQTVTKGINDHEQEDQGLWT